MKFDVFWLIWKLILEMPIVHGHIFTINFSLYVYVCWPFSQTPTIHGQIWSMIFWVNFQNNYFKNSNLPLQVVQKFWKKEYHFGNLMFMGILKTLWPCITYEVKLLYFFINIVWKILTFHFKVIHFNGDLQTIGYMRFFYLLFNTKKIVNFYIIRLLERWP
jgi:hypothetical protein